MLKYRVIPTLLLKDVGLIKGICFDHSRRVGSLLPAIKVYNQREVDELVLLDVSATLTGRPPDFLTIGAVTPNCLMPLTVGGGISEIKHIQQLLKLGADKVIINSFAYRKPEFIAEAANIFGNQCIVVGIDVKKDANGSYQLFSHCGRQWEENNLLDWTKTVEDLGAGEILLTSIDRDGTMQGYDVDLVRLISDHVNIPVIAAGGAGNPQHAYEAIHVGKASAVAAASLFHFTEETPLSVKFYLSQQGLPIRKSV